MISARSHPAVPNYAMLPSSDWPNRLERALARLEHVAASSDIHAALAQGLVQDVGVDLAEIWMYDSDSGELHLAIRAQREADPGRPVIPPATSAMRSLIVEAIQRRQPLLNDDLDATQASAATDRPRQDRPCGYAAAPLVLRGESHGAILLGNASSFPPETAAALDILARQAALVLEHAHFVEEAQASRKASARQLERLTALTTITQQLLAADELDFVVRVVAESASRLCDAAGAIVQLIDDERQHLTVLATHGEPRAFFEQFQGSQLTDGFYSETAAGQALTRRRPVAVEDYAAWPTAYERKQMALDLGVRALVAAPMLVDGAPLGVLWVCDITPRSFAAEDVGLVQALADQAALAIQHTRLVQRGQDAAVLEERARLARDLHDSVTQSVFSLGMLARAAQTQHGRDSDRLGPTLARVVALSQDALQEMRALLYELRPTTVGEEGLAEALARLVATMQVRVEIPITFESTTDARPRGEAEHAIFRIVQESLSNAVKYAQATTIAVTVTERDGRLHVTVADDGIGFDPALATQPSADGRRGGMGLRSMRERAVAAGLTLRVESAPGAGCRIVVEAPLP